MAALVFGATRNHVYVSIYVYAPAGMSSYIHTGYIFQINRASVIVCESVNHINWITTTFLFSYYYYYYCISATFTYSDSAALCSKVKLCRLLLRRSPGFLSMFNIYLFSKYFRAEFLW